MPPTTGGSTNGNRISGVASRTSRACCGPAPSPSAHPAHAQRVLAAAVFRLSTSAVVDDSLVINDQKCGQSTFAATANSGSTTKSAPMAAGR